MTQYILCGIFFKVSTQLFRQTQQKFLDRRFRCGTHTNLYSICTKPSSLSLCTWYVLSRAIVLTILVDNCAVTLIYRSVRRTRSSTDDTRTYTHTNTHSHLLMHETIWRDLDIFLAMTFSSRPSERPPVKRRSGGFLLSYFPSCRRCCLCFSQ